MGWARIKGGASALPAFAVVLLACAGATPTPPPAIDRALAECVTDAECEALDADTVLTGTGCGPDKVTSYAAEEDEFRFDRCDVIKRRAVVGIWAVEGSQ